MFSFDAGNIKRHIVWFVKIYFFKQPFFDNYFAWVVILSPLVNIDKFLMKMFFVYFWGPKKFHLEKKLSSIEAWLLAKQSLQEKKSSFEEMDNEV